MNDYHPADYYIEEDLGEDQNTFLKKTLYSDVFWALIGFLSAALIAIWLMQAG